MSWIRRSFRQVKRKVLGRQNSDPELHSGEGKSTLTSDTSAARSGKKDKLRDENVQLQEQLDRAVAEYDQLLQTLYHLQGEYERAMRPIDPMKKYDRLKDALKSSIRMSKEDPQREKSPPGTEKGLLSGAMKYRRLMTEVKKRESKYAAMSKGDLRHENKTLQERYDDYTSTVIALKMLFSRLERDYEEAKLRKNPKRRYNIMKTMCKDNIDKIRDTQNFSLVLDQNHMPLRP